jgi:hypothetical protein
VNDWRNSKMIIILAGIIFFLFNFATSFIQQKSSGIILDDTVKIYHNYFFMKDTLPNMSLFWSLIPEV